MPRPRASSGGTNFPKQVGKMYRFSENREHITFFGKSLKIFLQMGFCPGFKEPLHATALPTDGA